LGFLRFFLAEYLVFFFFIHSHDHALKKPKAVKCSDVHAILPTDSEEEPENVLLWLLFNYLKKIQKHTTVPNRERSLFWQDRFPSLVGARAARNRRISSAAQKVLPREAL
jgi:hypothetical protein